MLRGIGYGFHLGLSIRDKSLLEYIQEQVKELGKIQILIKKSGNEAHYSITRKRELLEFIEMLLLLKQDTLLTEYQYRRFII